MRNHHHYLRKLLIVVLFIFAISDSHAKHAETTVFGKVQLEEVLKAICDLPEMQRLKDVEQFGTATHLMGIPDFSRYEHSLDVCWLVQHFGGSLQEQIAALIHDVSHTVFSHVGDVVFNNPDYQDNLLEKILTDSPQMQSAFSSPWVLCARRFAKTP